MIGIQVAKVFMYQINTEDDFGERLDIENSPWLNTFDPIYKIKKDSASICT